MKKLQAGSCVYRVDGSRKVRPYFVITEPQGNPPKVIVVNLTDFETHHDHTVVLEEGHPAIRKKSAVAYRFTQFWDVAEVETELNDNEKRTDLHFKEPVCSEELVKQLRQGLMNSQSTPIKFKRFLAEHLGV